VNTCPKKFGSARLSALKKSGYLHLKKRKENWHYEWGNTWENRMWENRTGKPALGE
jgi:hypothetical protein